MPENFLQGVLPLSKIPLKYFDQKRVGIDFCDLAARTAEYTAYELLLKHDTRPLTNYFRTLIDGLLSLNATVYLIVDGEPLVLRAHTTLPELSRRHSSLAQSKWLFKEGNKRDSYDRLVQAFEVAKDQMREIIAALSAQFVDKYFYAVCAPHESFAQINYMAHSQMLDCVLSNQSIYALCGADMIQNFRLAHDNSYLGELVSAAAMRDVFAARGGFDAFLDLYMLAGNSYFPGFWKSFDCVEEVYKQCNGSVIAAACRLNAEHNDRYYKMTDDQLFKGIYQFYCHFYYGIVYKFDSKTFANANPVDPADAAILDKYFEKKALGFVVDKTEVVASYAAGFDKNVKGAKLEECINYKKLAYLSQYGIKFATKSVLELLKASVREDSVYVAEYSFNLRVISFQGSYLENKQIEQQKKFRYVRAVSVDYNIEDPVFLVKEEGANADEVIIKF